MTARRITLGVDAGGTKTVAWLAALQPAGEFEVLGRGTAGPGNPLRVGREAAVTNVATAIAFATDDAELPTSEATQAIVGMAGAGRVEVQQETSSWLQQQTGIDQIQVLPDYELILPAAFSDRNGIAVISGTGSIVHGVRGEKRTRVGGWGYLVDDQGSGYWLGRSALQALARAADGRGPNTVISELVSTRVAATATAAEVITSFYDSPYRLTQIASLAPIVFEAVAEGDSVAEQIAAEAAEALAEMIVAAARQLGYSNNEVPLAIAGGVLVGTPAFKERLLAILNEQSLKPFIVECVKEPVIGALQLAAGTHLTKTHTSLKRKF